MNAVGQLLLGQSGLPSQVFDRAPQGSVVRRSRFGLTARRHCQRQPSRQAGWTLVILLSNASAPKAVRVPICRRLLDNILSNVQSGRRRKEGQAGNEQSPWSAHPGSSSASLEEARMSGPGLSRALPARGAQPGRPTVAAVGRAMR